MTAPSEAYRRAGVDIDAGNRAVELMRAAVASTHGRQVLAGTGAFGGAYALGGEDVLVASADSVGTKLRLNALVGRHRDVGVDLVNHCANDVLAMGARPLFFLDYYASSRVVPEVVAAVVEGLAEACRAAACALLGGETAELPGMYAPGAYDIAGFMVGMARRGELLDGSRVRAGDVLVALPSSGLHTNGFSLVHHVLSDGGSAPITARALRRVVPELGGSLEDALLEPHRSYLPDVLPLVRRGDVHAVAHITGGGIVENVPRVIPDGLCAHVDTRSWTPPPIFGWLRDRGGITDEEMYRVFNMGAGLVLVLAQAHLPQVLAGCPGAWIIGEVTEGEQRLSLSGVGDA